MTTLTLTKTSIIHNRWDSKTQTYIPEPIGWPLPHLRDSCSIADGVCLGDIFLIVSRSSSLVAFLSAYSSCPVEEFHAEAVRPPSSERSDLDHIEIARYIDSEDHGLEIYVDISGVGQGTRWAIEFTPVNELIHLPVVLKSTVEVRKDYTTLLAEVPTFFTLLDILDAIYYEISFLGSPSDRDARSADLQGMVADLTAEGLIPND